MRNGCAAGRSEGSPARLPDTYGSGGKPRRARVRARRAMAACLAAATLAVTSGGCSVRKFAVRKLGDALAGAGGTYATDNDPELVREAIPFGLKLIESLLVETPDHRGLLLAAASGFTQYGYAFVQEDADEIEDRDLRTAAAMRTRARGLYVRARDYALRGLEVKHPGFGRMLKTDPPKALAGAVKDDVPFLYWAAASWGAAISVSKSDPDFIADLPLVGALAGRALELDETWDDGTIHELMVSYEAGRPAASGGSFEKARKHWERAMELSGGRRASAYLAMAESVSVGRQDRPEFEMLLNKALAVDPAAKREWQLSNLIMQRRARWLLGRVDELFVD
jgi:predicted anti-sigma-YlaC factor YlaD